MEGPDPFDNAPAAPDEAQAAPAAPEPAFEPPPADPPAKAAPAKAAAKKAGTVTVDVKPNLLPLDGGKVVLTFKGGTGFDAPWVVLHCLDLQDAHDQVHGENAVLLAEIMDRSQKIGAHFAGLAPAKASGNSSAPAQRQAAPAAAQAAPGGEKRFCEHGEMRFRSGTSKAGKAYSAFFCASGDRDNECKAQFLR